MGTGSNHCVVVVGRGWGRLAGDIQKYHMGVMIIGIKSIFILYSLDVYWGMGCVPCMFGRYVSMSSHWDHVTNDVDTVYV